MGSASKVLLRRKSMASGGASAHCCPGDLHAWPKRFEEAKSLLRKAMRVACRVLGEGHDLTLTMRMNYARALYSDPAATLANLREAVTTLEEGVGTARRVLGGQHPLMSTFEGVLLQARFAVRARETS